jgi:hypothetical protein
MSPQSKAKARTKQKPRTWKGWAVQCRLLEAPLSVHLVRFDAVESAMEENAFTGDSDAWVQRVLITEQPTKARS